MGRHRPIAGAAKFVKAKFTIYNGCNFYVTERILRYFMSRLPLPVNDEKSEDFKAFEDYEDEDESSEDVVDEATQEMQDYLSILFYNSPFFLSTENIQAAKIGQPHLIPNLQEFLSVYRDLTNEYLSVRTAIRPLLPPSVQGVSPVILLAGEISKNPQLPKYQDLLAKLKLLRSIEKISVVHYTLRRICCWFVQAPFKEPHILEEFSKGEASDSSFFSINRRFKELLEQLNKSALSVSDGYCEAILAREEAALARFLAHYPAVTQFFWDNLKVIKNLSAAYNKFTTFSKMLKISRIFSGNRFGILRLIFCANLLPNIASATSSENTQREFSSKKILRNIASEIAKDLFRDFPQQCAELREFLSILTIPPADAEKKVFDYFKRQPCLVNYLYSINRQQKLMSLTRHYSSLRSGLFKRPPNFPPSLGDDTALAKEGGHVFT